MQMCDENDNVTSKFEPFKDDCGQVIELADDYVKRMQSGLLPNWPKEPLVECLHRHHEIFLDRYSFLAVDQFQFKHEIWQLNQIPGREAFKLASAFDEYYSGFEEQLKNPYNWLATFMVINGTWNTPVILLEHTEKRFQFPGGEESLNSPYHLLEGHRRLSYLGWLRDHGRALPIHPVWVVTIPVRTEDYLGQRAKHGKREKFEQAMAKVAKIKPIEGDELESTSELITDSPAPL